MDKNYVNENAAVASIYDLMLQGDKSALFSLQKINFINHLPIFIQKYH
jgi:hypothetical protein